MHHPLNAISSRAQRAATFAVPALIALGAALPAPAMAQASSTPATSNKDQVVVPQVERRPVAVPRIASKDFEVGLFGGLLSVQNFGSSFVGGLRLGYHLSEDYFAEFGYGAAKVDDDTYRQILPGGVFPTGTSSFKTMNLSMGVNVLPGEVFLGANRAKATAVYLIGGVGSTSFNDQRRQTFNFGGGLRVYLAERMALRVDVRDHLFSLDLLGKRERTHNVELSAGVSMFF